MNDDDRQAIVWDKIERIAFHPQGDKECSTWLSLYARSLNKLWAIPASINYLHKSANFEIPFLDLKCDYVITNEKKYSVSLQHLSTSDKYWQNDIDPDYLSKASLHSANSNYPIQEIKTHLKNDITSTLDGMLFHPRCHAHIENIGVRHVQLDQSLNGLSTHEIRIGGSIENPYVFLFHLRYQFCLVSKVLRDNERNRLIELFEEAVKTPSTVTANKLFDC